MMLYLTASKAQNVLAKNLRAQRVTLGLTQAGLAKRSGVPLPTLRKFEQKGLISLESFLKIVAVLDMLKDIVKATEQTQTKFSSIDEVLKIDEKPKRKKGWRT